VAPHPDEAQERRASLVQSLASVVSDARVLDAMTRVPRHLFVPGASLDEAYFDGALPIGHGQTISQPTVVAMMTEALELQGGERVLEVGTGSGYQAAVLSLLAAEVYSVEVVAELADEARARLQRLGYSGVHVRVGNGSGGWPEKAPFDGIIATAAPERIPHALFEQLSEHGILVAPVGPSGGTQSLLRYRRTSRGPSTEDLGLVQFVPMIGGD
jgi:protein-L-isoaspartate(D-aspartate) O-methyltransferase